MSDQNFFTRRSRQTFMGICWDIFSQQIRDSPAAYMWIALATAAGVTVEVFFATSDFSKAINLLKSFSTFADLYALLPPFMLTIIALFPSFSDNTKEKLRELRKDGRPKVAPFLEQFLYLVFIGLCLYLFSKILPNFSDFLTTTAISLENKCILIGSSFGLVLFLTLSLLYELFNSLKVLYVLVICEYF